MRLAGLAVTGHGIVNSFRDAVGPLALAHCHERVKRALARGGPCRGSHSAAATGSRFTLASCRKSTLQIRTRTSTPYAVRRTHPLRRYLFQTVASENQGTANNSHSGGPANGCCRAHSRRRPRPPPPPPRIYTKLLYYTIYLIRYAIHYAASTNSGAAVVPWALGPRNVSSMTLPYQAGLGNVIRPRQICLPMPAMLRFFTQSFCPWL